jgi:hypothetical protein
MHRVAVLNKKYGSAGAPINAPVAKKCGLALARPAGVKNTKEKKVAVTFSGETFVFFVPL